jgi:hypothetical protein
MKLPQRIQNIFPGRERIVSVKTMPRRKLSIKEVVVRGVFFLLLSALLVGAPVLSGMRPRDIAQMLAREHAPWEGVLTLGVTATFPASGSTTAYVREVVKAFEKENPGVLVSVKEMQPYTLSQALEAGVGPDVLIFGAGAVGEPTKNLMPLEGDFSSVRADWLEAAKVGGKAYAVPLAVGGYTLIAHDDELAKVGVQGFDGWTGALEGLSTRGNALQCLPKGYGYPAAGLFAYTNGAIAAWPQALPANLGAQRREMAWPDFALERKTVCYLATPYELGRMRMLQAGGRVGAWSVLPCEGTPYTDLVLLAGVVRPEKAGRGGAEDNARRAAAAGTLLASFMGGQARAALVKTGLVPATQGEALYEGIAGSEEMERQLMGETFIPNVFDLRESIAAAGEGVQGAQAYLTALGWRPSQEMPPDTPPETASETPL